jgi:hypothetical protein
MTDRMSRRVYNLHATFTEEAAEMVKAQAARRGMSVSTYLEFLVRTIEDSRPQSPTLTKTRPR